MSDRIKDLVARIRESKPKTKAAKSMRTHKFTEPNYTIFAAHVRSHGKHAQDVLDELVALYLQQAQDDLSEADRANLQDVG